MSKQKAKEFWETSCKKHGVSQKDPGLSPKVKVSQPRHKRDQLRGGCPHCKREKLKK